jgi:hypothetical protein
MISPNQTAPLARLAAYFFFTTLLTTSLAAQDQAPKPPQDVFTVATQDALTKTLAERGRQAWDAFKKDDSATFATFTTDDYRAVLANGSMHFYRFTAQEMAFVNITQYVISQFQALPIGHDGALVTYIGLFSLQNGSTYLKVFYSEVWVKQGTEWKCQYSQGTLTL